MALVAWVAATVFVVASFWGGFRILFPWHTLSVTTPVRPLLIALIFAFSHLSLIRWRSKSGEVIPSIQACVVPSLKVMHCWVLFIALVLMVRFVFRGYEQSLLGRNISVRFILLCMVYVAVAGVGAWRFTSALWASGNERGAWLGAVMWVLSALAFPVAVETVLAFVLAAVWIPFSAHAVAVPQKVTWRIWVGCMLGVALLYVAWSAVAGPGWAMGRLRSEFASRLGGLEALFLYGFGGIVLLKSRVQNTLLVRAALLAILGVALGGARGLWGVTGILLFMPLMALCASVAWQTIEHCLDRPTDRLARNILALCVAGLIAGYIGGNLRRSLREPRILAPLTHSMEAGMAHVYLSGDKPECDLEMHDQEGLHS